MPETLALPQRITQQASACITEKAKTKTRRSAWPWLRSAPRRGGWDAGPQASKGKSGTHAAFPVPILNHDRDEELPVVQTGNQAGIRRPQPS